MTPEQFSQLLTSRRSTRDFLSTPIPSDVLEGIFEDGRHCASWSNTRPYMVAAASGERLSRMSARYLEAFDKSLGLQHKNVKSILKAPFEGSIPDGDFKAWKPYPADLLPRSQKIGKELYGHMGVERGDRAARDEVSRRNLQFFGAPTVLWFFVHKKLLPFSAMDVGIFLQTIMLSAKARGVDSCALGVLSLWRWPIDEEFDVPKDYKLITGLALGYASDDHVNDFRADHPEVQFVKPLNG